MIKKSLFENSRLIVVFCLLSLIAVSMGGAWCFETERETQVQEMALYDCHSIPSLCYMPGRDRLQNTNQSEQSEHSDCTACLDVSFEELLNTGVQSRPYDVVPLLAAAHFQFLVNDLPVLNNHLPLSPHSNLLPHTPRANLRSLQTTVLLI
jgi:hypothetical protein